MHHIGIETIAFGYGLLQAQTIPTAPNKTDANGLRQGEWVILYGKDWKVILRVLRSQTTSS